MELNAFVVALALAVVKAKPESLSFKEYLHRTYKAHLPVYSTEQDLQPDSEQTKQLQHVIKQQEAQLQTQNDEIIALEHKQKQLEDVMKTADSKALLAYVQSLVPINVEVCTSSSAARQHSDIVAALPKHELNTLLLSTLRVEYVIRGGGRLDVAAFADNLLVISSSILQLIKNFLLRSTPLESAALARPCITVCAKAASILIDGEKVLGLKHADTNEHRAVDFAIISLYNQIMQYLGELRKHELLQDTSAQLNTVRPSTRSTTKSYESMQSKKAEQARLSMLMALVIHILEALDVHTPSHKRLFEGFVACKMSVIGQILFKITFGHARGASVEHDIRTACSMAPSQVATDTSHLHSSMPSLVHVLKHALDMAPLFAQNYVLSTNPATSSTGAMEVEGTLSTMARLGLQEMLLRSIFGDNMEGDGPLKTVLAAKEHSLKPPVLPLVNPTNIDQWFQEEVWRVIGWDILTENA